MDELKGFRSSEFDDDELTSMKPYTKERAEEIAELNREIARLYADIKD